MENWWNRLRRLALVWTTAGAGTALLSAAEPELDFNRDVRPILAEACFHCHGPDARQRQAELRLDTQEGATAEREGRRAVVPGHPDQSELWRRVSTGDAAERMPPPDSAVQLTAAQVATLRRWIAAGAPWQAHWSLIPPRRAPLPEITTTAGNPIDAFLQARQQGAGLVAAPQADRATLLRRVTLDLTGLPPTLEEQGAFLADQAPDAYERVVDRLLASPAYGERMAIRWLEAARYADTSGYQSDGERVMWRWRDWVIDAYNANMPYDQFTIEQLAGDLLPQATVEQQIATGFNRNVRGNGEGGIVPEEYLVEYVVDRVDTTATVWMAMTMGCTRCHDHKYDPLSQKDFYRLYAFFNNVPELGRVLKYGNSPPYVKSPTRDQLAAAEALRNQLAAARQARERLQPAFLAAQAAWEKNAAATDASDWNVERGLVLRADWQALPWRANAAADAPRHAAARPGPAGLAAEFDGQGYVEAGDVANFGFADKFSIAAWVRPQHANAGAVVSRMTDVPQGDGWGVAIIDGQVQVHLTKRWLDDALRVATVDRVPVDAWTHLTVVYDGSRVAAGVQVFLNGQPAKLHVLLDELNQTFATKEPLRIGGGYGTEGRFRGQLNDVRIFNVDLAPAEALSLSAAATVAIIATRPVEQRTAAEREKLQRYFLLHQAPSEIRAAELRVTAAQRALAAWEDSFPTTMVMAERPTIAPTHVLIRGEYNRPGEPVERGVPQCLPPLPDGAPNNRLGLAQWLVAPEHPLTSRVAVNRLWQMFFGQGLVKTIEDFGVQGDWPLHQDLLDWLAVEFRESGWNVKHVQRLIVTSAAYRQQSSGTLLADGRPARAVDPENLYYARGPRVRLSAEMVRDQALSAAGLLMSRTGGPSVRPYQPAGLWKELAGGDDYVQDHGEALYRRSLYTYWKRTVAPPMMVTFDAAGRETCTVREVRTNTPLQALTLLNDVAFVETARQLAQRAASLADDPAAAVAVAFRLVLCRPPSAAEAALLQDSYAQHLAHYRQHPDAARQLLATGESPAPSTADPAPLAALTALGSTLLNLDETVTKP